MMPLAINNPSPRLIMDLISDLILASNGSADVDEHQILNPFEVSKYLRILFAKPPPGNLGFEAP